MKFKSVLLLLALIASATCAATKTVLNTAACASKDFRDADAELNATYKKVIQRFKEDTARVRSIKETQRQWILFRDLEATAISESSAGGSIHGDCLCAAVANLQRDRTIQLKRYLEGVEGDGCAP